jgi:hypothetical protein
VHSIHISISTLFLIILMYLIISDIIVVQFLTRNRTYLLPHYARLVATLNPYMPEIGTKFVSTLDEEFRYLQRKKKDMVGYTVLLWKKLNP